MGQIDKIWNFYTADDTCHCHKWCVEVSRRLPKTISAQLLYTVYYTYINTHAIGSFSLGLEMVVISFALLNPICNARFSFVNLLSDLRCGSALTRHLDDEWLHVPGRALEEQAVHEHRLRHPDLLLLHHHPLHVRMHRSVTSSISAYTDFLLR